MNILSVNLRQPVKGLSFSRNICATFAMLFSVASQAAIINETEINDSFASADAALGGDVLQGSIGDGTAASNDVDIWQFGLIAGSGFTASISYAGLWNPVDVNPVMVLFWENSGNYYPVASTNPDTFGTIFSFTPWASGNYFLAITADFNQGVDAFGNFSSDWSFQTSENILGTSWAGWNGQSFTSFDYSVTTIGVTNPVPVPAAVWLFGSGLLGLLGVVRKRSRSE